MTHRSTKDGPWCWLSKAALRLIRHRLERSSNAERTANALVCYLALTELASDRQSESFEASFDDLVRLTHISWRSIQRCTAALEEIGALQRERKERTAVYRYTLIAMEMTQVARCHGGMSRDATALVGVQNGVAPLEKNPEKNTEKKVILPSGCSSIPSGNTKKGGKNARAGVEPGDPSRNGASGRHARAEEKDGPPVLEKAGGNERPAPACTLISDERELMRVRAAIRGIEDSYDSHRDFSEWSESDRKRFRELRSREKELMARHGWKE